MSRNQQCFTKIKQNILTSPAYKCIYSTFQTSQGQSNVKVSL